MFDYFSNTYRTSHPGALEISMMARRKEREFTGQHSEYSLVGLLLAAFGLPSWR